LPLELALAEPTFRPAGPRWQRSNGMPRADSAVAVDSFGVLVAVPTAASCLGAQAGAGARLTSIWCESELMAGPEYRALGCAALSANSRGDAGELSSGKRS
jgi:hypothetical protein